MISTQKMMIQITVKLLLKIGENMMKKRPKERKD
jgi:hypothetical protein